MLQNLLSAAVMIGTLRVRIQKELSVCMHLQENIVNSEIFARIKFSRITLKDMFAMLKIGNWCMIYLHQ